MLSLPGMYRVDLNRFVRLNKSIAVSIGNIMCHQELVVGISVAVATVRDAVRVSYLVMKLPIGSGVFVAIIVSA